MLVIQQILYACENHTRFPQSRYLCMSEPLNYIEPDLTNSWCPSKSLRVRNAFPVRAQYINTDITIKYEIEQSIYMQMSPNILADTRQV